MATVLSNVHYITLNPLRYADIVINSMVLIVMLAFAEEITESLGDG